MRHILTKEESKTIIERYGLRFYDKVISCIEYYSNKWLLEDIKLIDCHSANCIFVCRTQHYGDAALKICKPGKQVCTEINTLKEYGGNRFLQTF